MGQAKNRGTFEQRKVEAIDRKRDRKIALEIEELEKCANMTLDSHKDKLDRKKANDFLEVMSYVLGSLSPTKHEMEITKLLALRNEINRNL